MNKLQLVKIVSGKLEIDQKTVNIVLNEIIETIGETVADGEEVMLVNFGTFGNRFRKSRTFRNPKTGAEVEAPDAVLPHFKPGRGLKRKVNELL